MAGVVEIPSESDVARQVGGMCRVRFASHILCALALVFQLNVFAATNTPGPYPSVVKILQKDGAYDLLLNGKPYFIQGAGGWKHLEELKATGGNSVRTWGASTDGEILDKAQSLGMTVTMGIWLGHKDQAFDYNNPEQVKKQFDDAKGIVERYKNHPALLIWGVGNEMEGVEGNEKEWGDPAVWRAVEDIAQMIKKIDPKHPVITVVAEIDAVKVAAIKKYCPSLDALGVNSYGSLPTLPERLRAAGWDKPYIVTELGPRGPWQIQKTSWGAPIEPTSGQKAASYFSSYKAAVDSQRGYCLGSYFYLWGHEEKAVSQTHTWYSSFLPESEERLAAVDAITLAWTGKLPANSAPEIVYWQTDTAFETVAPNSQHQAFVLALDPEGDPISVSWEVRRESPTLGAPAPPPLRGIIGEVDGMHMNYTAPEEPGPYRLFVYVRDGKGSVATANVPFLVTAIATPRSQN